MKKYCIKKYCAALVLSLVGVSGTAQADAPYQGYIGISYAQLEQYDRFFGGDRFDTGEVFVRLGGRLTDIFDSEIRLGSTIQTQSNAVFEFRHDYIITGLLRAGYSFGAFRPYIAAGYTFGQERLKIGSDEVTDTFRDVSYGGGVDVSLGERLGLNVEMLNYYEIGNLRLQGPSAGVTWRF
ncbi:MAG: porin family protein [Alcanivorax sp.]|nr:porin family protein [Alcanivorax sp.]